MNARVIIVSNRLPVAVKQQDNELTVVATSGGLATGLKGPHECSQGLWVGWPGDAEDFSPELKTTLESQLASLRYVPVYLSRNQREDYYSGFSNGVLWPLFHYLIDRVPADALAWEAYRHVNKLFAERVIEHYRPGDIIWVHDYHLMLVPQLLRERLPGASIGYFLHIPFPSSEVFRILPWRREVLSGLLGANIIGFHTYTYARHFTSALLRVHGIDTNVDRVYHQERHIRVGAFPLGVDAAAFAHQAAAPELALEQTKFRPPNSDVRILLAIDRLDYTKGIPRRLAAFERLLELEPTWCGRVKMIQIAVPTRTDSPAYLEFKRQVEEAISRINGRHGTFHWTPITYLYQSFNQQQVVAMFRAADVMLVTPLRDGMNLVAKEFLASRIDEQGVLVLSEFAGAAAELGEALIVNPYDVEDVAHTMHRALTMSCEEQSARMRALRERVQTYDVYHWADTFIKQLEESTLESGHSPTRLSQQDGISTLARELSAVPKLLVLLDYDGTLVPFERSPDLALPDEGLKTLLTSLATCPETSVHVLSGRSKESLEAWLGDLPIGLCAEHGHWVRSLGAMTWMTHGEPISDEWRIRLLEIMRQFSDRVGGARIEEKRSSLVWHYRNVDAWLGTHLAFELRLHLAELLSNAPFEVIPGHKVVELRRSGINKGAVVKTLLESDQIYDNVLAIGDDITDEDIFRQLPKASFSIKVGPGNTNAAYRIKDYRSVRQLLTLLTELRKQGP